jgi:glycosyltransferase involved in cell wall biosynthesis
VNESLVHGLAEYCSVRYFTGTGGSEDTLAFINKERSASSLVCIDSLYLIRKETELLVKIRHLNLPMLLLCHYLPSLDPFLSEEDRRAREEEEYRQLSRFEAVVCPSSFLAERIRRITGGSASVFHIPPGIRNISCRDQRHGTHYAEREHSGTVRLLTVSNWTPLKNLHFFLPIFETAEHKNLRWRIAGYTDTNKTYRQEMKRKIARSRKSCDITVLGSVDQDVLFHEYEQADILIHPSLIESYGLAAAEAIAQGRPVLAHRTGGIAEIVRHEVSGFLCSINNTAEWTAYLDRLCSSAELRRRMSEAALRSRQSLNAPEDAARQFYKAVLSVLSTHNHGERKAGSYH